LVRPPPGPLARAAGPRVLPGVRRPGRRSADCAEPEVRL